MVLFAGPTPTSSAYEASEVLWAHPQEEARQPGASLWAGAVAIPLTRGLAEGLQSAAPMRLPRSPEDMELEAALRGTDQCASQGLGTPPRVPCQRPRKACARTRVAAPATGDAVSSGPGAVRVAGPGTDGTAAPRGGHAGGGARRRVVMPPGQLEDWAPEWRAEFKKFPAAKVDSLAMLLLGGPPL